MNSPNKPKEACAILTLVESINGDEHGVKALTQYAKCSKKIFCAKVAMIIRDRWRDKFSLACQVADNTARRARPLICVFSYGSSSSMSSLWLAPSY